MLSAEFFSQFLPLDLKHVNKTPNIAQLVGIEVEYQTASVVVQVQFPAPAHIFFILLIKDNYIQFLKCAISDFSTLYPNFPSFNSNVQIIDRHPSFRD